MAGAGQSVGLLHDERAREDVPIVVRLPRALRSSTDAVRAIRLGGPTPVAVGELTRVAQTTESRSIYHKNLRPVTYVTADVAGAVESPVYAILADEQGARPPAAARGLRSSRSSTRGSRSTARATR